MRFQIRQLLLVSLGLLLITTSSNAATILVGRDLATPGAPTLSNNVIANGGSASFDIYLSLDSGLSVEMASVFQASFGLALGTGFSATLDLSRVDPGVSPFGVGTWPGGVGNCTAPGSCTTSANVSLTSANLGGDRLVAQIVVMNNSGSAGPAVQITLDSILVAKDIPTAPFTMSVPVDVPVGTVLVPEPSVAALLGLVGVGLATRRRRRV